MAGLKAGHLCQVVPFRCSENHLESLCTWTASPPEADPEPCQVSPPKSFHGIPSAPLLPPTSLPWRLKQPLACPPAPSISLAQSCQHHQNILRLFLEPLSSSKSSNLVQWGSVLPSWNFLFTLCLEPKFYHFIWNMISFITSDFYHKILSAILFF